MNNKTIKALIECSREGSSDAFRGIFEHLHDRLFFYASSHMRIREDALDIVQETFVDLWKSIRGIRRFTYNSDEEFYGFVFLILKRKISRHKYKNAIKNSLPFNENIATEGYEMEHEDYRHVLKAIEKLAAEFQELIKLRYWADMSFGEIALVLNINENTAKVKHYRALQKLKAYLAYYNE